MQIFEFKSFAISNEINLNIMAEHFGITKKYRWEDHLVLDENLLKGIIAHPEGKTFHIFHFGSIVGTNLTLHEIKDILDYLKKFDKNLNGKLEFSYNDEFRLEIKKGESTELSNDRIISDELMDYHPPIIATILAKSVALEKIESDTDLLLDEIEKVIEFLDKGHLNLSDEKLAKISSKVLRFKFNTISHIMLLDKPDIAWNDEQAEQFYIQMADLFELYDRYETIKSKAEILMDVTEVFSGLAHAKRGTRLEWMIIILISVEIVMSLLYKIF
ncbi:RMD1 family protein [Desulforegula conservatrix]|uniref:RMD1 family protein n=1 Tax=Desulforegula conservatrix TaxID=153026 RepID=UPI00041DC427|nr:RMD1 family protein [Desulforegula conservatrix]